jgi:hypothetical protein
MLSGSVGMSRDGRIPPTAAHPLSLFLSLSILVLVPASCCARVLVLTVHLRSVADPQWCLPYCRLRSHCLRVADADHIGVVLIGAALLTIDSPLLLTNDARCPFLVPKRGLKEEPTSPPRTRRCASGIMIHEHGRHTDGEMAIRVCP